MSPPIYTPDGSEVSEIVLPDGSTASEVIGPDGNVVFEAGPDIPDSAIHQYDATAISGLNDGDSVNNWENQIGTSDATAGTSPTYKTDVINGNPVVRFDGVNDYLTASIGTETQPTTFVAVYQVNGDVEGEHAMAGAGATENLHTYRIRKSLYLHFAGSGLNGGSPSNSPELGVLVFDGSGSVYRVNGSQVLNGDIGSNSLTDLTLGRRANQDQYFDGDIGEFVIYDTALSGDDLDSEEQRLADKWGITI